MGFNSTRHIAIDHPRDHKQQEDQRHDGLHNGGLKIRQPAIQTQGGIRRQEPQSEQRRACRRRGQTRLQAAPLQRGHRFKPGHGLRVAVDRRHPGQARLDQPVSEGPGDSQHQQGGRSREDVVAKHGDIHRRIKQMRRALGEALQQGLQRAGEDEVGGIPPGDAGEGGGDARQRMAPGGIEDNAPQRRHQHIAGIRRVGTGDAHQDDHGREQTFYG